MINVSEHAPRYILAKAIRELQESNNTFLNTTLVESLDQLPTPVGNVITLTGGNWWIMSHLDLLGNRLVLSGINALFGFSSETSSITSTGLPNGQTLITANSNTPMQNLTIKNTLSGRKAVSLTGTGSEAIDWKGVNFENCATVGDIISYGNFIMQDSAFLNSAGLTFNGSCGTIGFSNTFFSLPTGTLITLAAGLTISRRFRIIYSSFVVLSGNVGINASTSASIPVEGYILDNVNFSGGGTYLSGVTYSDNKALFLNNKGINNSANVAFVSMHDNVTATTISATATPTPISGTFLLDSISQRWSLTAPNTLQYIGGTSQVFKITFNATITGSTGNVVGMYVAKNGTVIDISELYSTISTSGKAEGVSAMAVVRLNTGDTIRVFIENNTATANVTVTHLTGSCELQPS